MELVDLNFRVNVLLIMNNLLLTDQLDKAILCEKLQHSAPFVEAEGSSSC